MPKVVAVMSRTCGTAATAVMADGTTVAGRTADGVVGSGGMAATGAAGRVAGGIAASPAVDSLGAELGPELGPDGAEDADEAETAD